MARWLSWLERRPVTAEVEGSSPFWVVQLNDKKFDCTSINGVLAQLGEHLPYKQRVTGSSPVTSIFFGGVAQLARACGSYPQCRGFKSLLRYHNGVSPSGKATDSDSVMRRFESCYPSQHISSEEKSPELCY